MGEWKEHFMRLLGGVEERVVRGQEKKGRKEGESDIEWEEIKRTIEKLRVNKAMGIPNEVWKYGGEEMGKWAWEVCRRVWKGEG